MKGRRCTGWTPDSRRVIFGLIWLSLASLAVTAGAQTVRLTNPAASRYDVVALRVEFQRDSSRFSSGDGTFDGPLFPDTDPPGIDPLPHDADYFRAHLTFLENYISRVSDGRTLVNTHLLPSVVQVSGEMAEYAPIGMESDSDAELSKLASLVREAWSNVTDPLPPGLDPDRTAFVLFHAGVGRDLELLGTTLDKTPEDLPSLFFDQESLTRLIGSSSVVVDGVEISNTLLIPRTETRRGTDFIQNTGFLAEFSINGMLAASFLNYLGVPDLFDSATGESAIGPFGVMDGLGIFAFSGLIPPEPSAWTKLYLGWADVVEPSATDSETFTLIHSGDASRNDVLVVPVSAGEYFLVENRNRDPEGDGVTLRVWKDGAYSDVRFENGANDFNSATTSGFSGGVVTDVDNFDFALPGGKDEKGTLLNGGILIWHVDERRLAAGLPGNTVNADPKARSVDLEEADGAQDLGFPNRGLFGPAFDVGSPFDFFYEGNPVSVITATDREKRLYENRFGPDTIPGSRSNAGGASFVELTDFSVPGSEMQVTYNAVAEPGIDRRVDLNRDFPGIFGAGASPGDVSGRGKSSVRYVGRNGFEYLVSGVSQDGEGHLVLSRSLSLGGDVVLNGLLDAAPVMRGDQIVALSAIGFRTVDTDGSVGFLSSEFPSTLRLQRALTPVLALEDGSVYAGVRADRGDLILSVTDGILDIRAADGLRSLVAMDDSRLVVVGEDAAEIQGTLERWTYPPLQTGEDIQAVFGSDSSGLLGVLTDPGAGSMYVLTDGGVVETIDVNRFASGTESGYPVVVDLDRDGSLDILVEVGNSLLAFNRSGAVLDGFPIGTRAFSGSQPLVADLTSSGGYSILLSGSAGRIDAYDTGNAGKEVSGFPLSAGASSQASPTLEGGRLAGFSSGGSLRVWNLEGLAAAALESENGRGNNNFQRLEGGPGPGPRSGRLFVEGQTYNWPNPVRDGVTRFRILVTDTSDIRIKIVNMAGILIDTLEKPGVRGGLPVDVLWQTTVGSGLYFARVTATSTGGRTESELVKVAVIR